MSSIHIAINCASSALCIVTAVIALLVYLHLHFIPLLVFIIASFVLAAYFISCIFARIITKRIYIVAILGQMVFSAFYIASGIFLVIRMIQQKLVSIKDPKHWNIVVPVIFITNIILIAFSLLYSYLQFKQEGNTGIQDLEIGSQVSSNFTHVSAAKDSKGGEFHASTDPLCSFQNPAMTKKVSENTLISTNIHKIVEGQDAEYFLKSAEEHNKDSPSQYSVYNTQNWMESTSKIPSMSYSDLGNKEPTTETRRSRRGTFTFFSSNKSNSAKASRSSYDLRNSKSVPSFLKTHSPKSSEFKDKFMESQSSFNYVRQATSSQGNLQEKLPESTSKVSLSTILTENSSNLKKSTSTLQLHRTVTLLNSNSDGNLIQANNIEEIDEEEAEVNQIVDMMARSKSTSFLGTSKKEQRRHQRLQSIYGERTFLAQVNECLLPSVLKSGESPIMEVKRQQELVLYQSRSRSGTVTDEDVPANTEFNPPFLTDHGNALSPVGEVEGTLQEAEVESLDSDDEGNLPYLDEFDEPIDQSNFENFDQDMVVVTKSKESVGKVAKRKGVYNFTNLPHNEQEMESPTVEEYQNSLSGLEKIPLSSSGTNINWSSQNSNSHNPLHNISLSEWEERSHIYEEHRTRTGANFSINGISRLVSDHRLRSMGGSDVTLADKVNQTYNDEYLLPPVETRVDDIDNIDSLTEINSATGSAQNARRPSYNLSSRSYSAPSLHTFRNVSGKSNVTDSEGSEKLIIDRAVEDLSLRKYESPPEDQVIATSTANTSPIKKLLESPKRISSVFRRKSSRVSVGSPFELDIMKYHKHTGSSASNPVSVTSALSSRSGSPRKSIKSFLTTKSHHRHSSSVPSFSLPSSKPHTLPFPTSQIFANYDKTLPTYVGEEAIDFWDMDTNPGSGSRVSSVPSAVIGEYDREKWQTLKALQNNDKVSFEVSI
ncbi:uncharacterized protein RJT20DRAFT_58037 [Scheffersomyces xylosifermentans]|uniref:uncharacterized protein n=1 Tax=Scheffersomyces xylosifermentans TaxID=1304137 RepID=UPI00315C62C8